VILPAPSLQLQTVADVSSFRITHCLEHRSSSCSLKKSATALPIKGLNNLGFARINFFAYPQKL